MVTQGTLLVMTALAAAAAAAAATTDVDYERLLPCTQQAAVPAGDSVFSKLDGVERVNLDLSGQIVSMLATMQNKPDALSGQGAVVHPTCEMYDGTVHAMCNGEPVYKWGIGSEGQASAIKNCNHVARTGQYADGAPLKHKWGSCAYGATLIGNYIREQGDLVKTLHRPTISTILAPGCGAERKWPWTKNGVEGPNLFCPAGRTIPVRAYTRNLDDSKKYHCVVGYDDLDAKPGGDGGDDVYEVMLKGEATITRVGKTTTLGTDNPLHSVSCTIPWATKDQIFENNFTATFFLQAADGTVAHHVKGKTHAAIQYYNRVLFTNAIPTPAPVYFGNGNLQGRVAPAGWMPAPIPIYDFNTHKTKPTVEVEVADAGVLDPFTADRVVVTGPTYVDPVSNIATWQLTLRPKFAAAAISAVPGGQPNNKPLVTTEVTLRFQDSYGAESFWKFTISGKQETFAPTAAPTVGLDGHCVMKGNPDTTGEKQDLECRRDADSSNKYNNRCCRDGKLTKDRSNNWNKFDKRGCSSLNGNLYTESQCDNRMKTSYGGDSQKRVTWPKGDQACRDAGGRLCTLKEMAYDCTSGSGCGYDGQSVWTSTRCKSGDTSRCKW